MPRAVYLAVLEGSPVEPRTARTWLFRRLASSRGARGVLKSPTCEEVFGGDGVNAVDPIESWRMVLMSWRTVAGSVVLSLTVVRRSRWASGPLCGPGVERYGVVATFIGDMSSSVAGDLYLCTAGVTRSFSASTSSPPSCRYSKVGPSLCGAGSSHGRSLVSYTSSTLWSSCVAMVTVLVGPSGVLAA